MPKTLHLSLKAQPFEVMVTGEKLIEFRKPTAWIKSRFTDKKGHPKNYDEIHFVNGYGGHRPNFMAEFLNLSIASSNYSITYSNGLTVDVEEGDYCIQFKLKGVES